MVQKNMPKERKEPAIGDEGAIPTHSDEDLARIDEGIAAAQRGDYATDEEVRAEFARWRRLRRA